MNTLVCIIVSLSLLLLAYILMKRYRYVYKYGMKKGYSYLDKDNSRGGVIEVVQNASSPRECINKCKSNPNCAGLTYNDISKTCYMCKSGDFYSKGLPNDYAWVK